MRKTFQLSEADAHLFPHIEKHFTQVVDLNHSLSTIEEQRDEEGEEHVGEESEQYKRKEVLETKKSLVPKDMKENDKFAQILSRSNFTN